MLAMPGQAPVERNPRTTLAEVAEYREIVDAYRRGQIAEAIQRIEALPVKLDGPRVEPSDNRVREARRPNTRL